MALLDALLKDPLLADVPADVTLDEVRTLVALETGQAMRVTVVRYDGGRIGKSPAGTRRTSGRIRRSGGLTQASAP